METLCVETSRMEKLQWGVEVKIQELWLDGSWDFLWDREYGKGGKEREGYICNTINNSKYI